MSKMPISNHPYENGGAVAVETVERNAGRRGRGIIRRTDERSGSNHASAGGGSGGSDVVAVCVMSEVFSDDQRRNELAAVAVLAQLKRDLETIEFRGIERFADDIELVSQILPDRRSDLGIRAFRIDMQH
jgi:hypothetical protein